MKNYVFLALGLLLASCADRASDAPVDLADPMVGTGFHGHTYPGATAPHGAVQLSPDTRADNWDACSGYHYSDSTLNGFSHTHLSGTGCADLADIFVRPLAGEVSITDNPLYSPVGFSHKDETATPGYYSVKLADGITAELTATTRTGVHRYTFPSGETANLVFDLNHKITGERIDSASIKIDGPAEISGVRVSSGWTPNQYVYFVARFSQDFEKTQLNDNGTVAVLTFKNEGKPIVAKVGLSIVSLEGAELNLDTETGDFGFDFDAVREHSRQIWADELGAITVEGGTREERINFYSALYHTLIVPNIVNDVDGAYRRHDMTIDTVPAGENRYSTLSLWDTHRSWHPQMTLTDSKLISDIVKSCLDMYDKTGELPLWPLSAGETWCMIGYHSASVIAEAYLKGIRDFDAEHALEAMVVSSNKNRKGSAEYVAEGFIPANRKSESVSCTLEYAYNDWCIAQMAKALGHEDIYNEYIKRAGNYANVFDGSTRFFRGKNEDGTFEAPFEIYEPGRAYTEASPWQYRFFAPHDMAGLEQLYGSREALVAAMDSMYTNKTQPKTDFSDITGLIGQYAHGNEPSHNFAFLYNYVGQPWKSQELVRYILGEMYQPTPEGLCGNEDVGQMSAWYVLASLGLYPVAPASGEYVFTSPIFTKATIKLANGKTLEIKANDPARNKFIKDVTFNGKPVEANYITHAQLMEGGVLDFTLTDKAVTDRGTEPSWAPSSMSTEPMTSVPYTTTDLTLFTDNVTADLACTTPDAKIYYTLDGSEPTEASTLYEGPFSIDKSLTLKARAYKEGMKPGGVFSIKSTKAVNMPAKNVAAARNGVNYNYYEGYFSRGADIERKGNAVSKGTIANVSSADRQKEDGFGFVYTGYIDVPADGIYTFMTKSDDGSVLYIDGVKTVDNDGSHSAASATGRIALAKGMHAFRLEYFDGGEEDEISWGWKVPGSDTLEAIPDNVLWINN